MSSQPRKHLSHRLLALTLLAALLLGLLASLLQITIDAGKVRQGIRSDGDQVLAMFREPSLQAAATRDRLMAVQVVEGLLRHPGVSNASIRLQDGNLLASARQAGEPPARHWLTDRLFGREYVFGVRLQDSLPGRPPHGELSLTLDTHYQAARFLDSAWLTLLSSLAHALLLGLAMFLLYRWQLTLPLQRMIAHLTQIDPERPAARQLPAIRGHEHDELGLWVDTANQLLAAIARNQALRREAEHSLERMSQFDLLTGLPNRGLLQQQLEQIIIEARHGHQRVAIFCLGIDDFKAVNESYGYQSGDQLLMAVAQRLRSLEMQFNALARMGSDKFAMILVAFEQPYQAAELAQNLLDELARPFQIDQHEIVLRATLGITLYPEDGDSAEYLLQRAEQTMTLAKQQARNRYQFYIASVDLEIRQQRELEQELHLALQRGELELHYQPQHAYPDHRVVGVEALLRWRYPERGFISPERFIPLAEQNGLILKIGDWVLEQACQQLRVWHDRGLPWLRMAVNLSTSQLRNAVLPERILELTRRYGLPPRTLEVEVTETVLMEDVVSVAERLGKLREAQVLVAIDDFGTGYSSLNYLKSLPLDKIKIDRSFVCDLDADEDDANIVRAIIQLAHSLSIEVIAEGVENRAQEHYLIEHGCSEGQGFLYSRALPAEEAFRYIQNAERQHPPGASRTPAH